MKRPSNPFKKRENSAEHVARTADAPVSVGSSLPTEQTGANEVIPITLDGLHYTTAQKIDRTGTREYLESDYDVRIGREKARLAQSRGSYVQQVKTAVSVQHFEANVLSKRAILEEQRKQAEQSEQETKIGLLSPRILGSSEERKAILATDLPQFTAAKRVQTIQHPKEWKDDYGIAQPQQTENKPKALRRINAEAEVNKLL